MTSRSSSYTSVNGVPETPHATPACAVCDCGQALTAGDQVIGRVDEFYCSTCDTYIDGGNALGNWFTAELATCTPSLHAMSRHLPTRDEANAIATKHHAIGIVSCDAAHAASFGVDVERDMQHDAAEDAEHCERCDGSGWLEVADGYVECTCGEAV